MIFTQSMIKIQLSLKSNGCYFYQKVKECIIVAITSMKPKTLDAVSQITAVLRKATEEPDEVSLSSQVGCRRTE